MSDIASIWTNEKIQKFCTSTKVGDTIAADIRRIDTEPWFRIKALVARPFQVGRKSSVYPFVLTMEPPQGIPPVLNIAIPPTEFEFRNMKILKLHKKKGKEPDTRPPKAKKRRVEYKERSLSPSDDSYDYDPSEDLAAQRPFTSPQYPTPNLISLDTKGLTDLINAVQKNNPQQQSISKKFDFSNLTTWTKFLSEPLSDLRKMELTNLIQNHFFFPQHITPKKYFQDGISAVVEWASLGHTNSKDEEGPYMTLGKRLTDNLYALFAFNVGTDWEKYRAQGIKQASPDVKALLDASPSIQTSPKKRTFPRCAICDNGQCHYYAKCPRLHREQKNVTPKSEVL